MIKVNILEDGGLQVDPFVPSLPYIEVTKEQKTKIENGQLIYVNGCLVDCTLDCELNELRRLRERECFPYINRGNLWYSTLNEKELMELNNWYNDWLNVTLSKKIPDKPTWLK